jgi:regulation of enolase protein 1 (concanavalin A-like superfamily)
MKTKFLLFTCLLTSLFVNGQNIETMQWMNEPEKWEVKDGNLSMYVTPQSDYWRVTFHDFIVDDGPFYYTTRGGEFEVSVKIQGEYKSKYDQMGLMLRIDEEQWVKTGIEYVDGIYNFSTVVTDQHSSWSVIQFDEKPKAV